MVMTSPRSEFWSGKRVLVTGHTGFKGAWLCHWLLRLGAQVSGLALDPSSTPALYDLLALSDRLAHDFRIDIRNRAQVGPAVARANPEIVLHLAAQALVRPSYRAPVETFDVNVMGTVHVLEALRHCDATKVAVIVTTDKVYRNEEGAHPYGETDHLGGYDPYSASKAACEIAVASYRQSFLQQAGIATATARAGNVIGGGDWAEDRLLPDAVRAWHAGQPVEVRNPSALRPWQHVLEPLGGYLCLAQSLWNSPDQAQAWNFGPLGRDCNTVGELLEIAALAWGGRARIEVRADQRFHEAGTLLLDASKAQRALGYQPHWGTHEGVRRSISWYRAYYRQPTSARVLCDADIDAWGAAA
ncbi:CDP-glucose 4,6-dehydratase [Curvibacter sp. APW13]|uniref:CDP-glucose 4,6-dehydratase n=1 Tax=Curvibacter sp. APW13 TaxID=3077236 RepID=UPI0028DED547|nr:CDP-glucose 4,6-dehydratase [Curvibacter sp. APW13]MDT8993022.1 CDP-glucose 4,6-dehydratase [Curvibacter sp. APW13]